MADDNKNAPPNIDKESATRWSPLAIAKAEIIRSLVDQKPIPGELLHQACQQAARLLGKAKVPPATIYNWVKKYKSGGITALEHKQHRDGGQSTLHPDLRQYVEDLLKSRKNYSLAAVHRLAEQKARTMEIHEGFLPTYDQVRFINKQMSAAAKKYGREGARAYRNTNELTGRFEAEYPNQIWQCDHHLLDILIVNPNTGKAERPWLTAIIDDYSRAIMGIYLSFDNPNSNSIALALHHALCTKPQERWLMHGIPEIFYVDNGKDFRSRHIEEVCLHFQVERKSHEPYLARSKGKIERWFRTLEQMEIAYLDGYVGSSTAKRPEKVSPKLNLEQLRTRIIDFILNTYHERVHSETKEKPHARWASAPKVIRTIERLEDLDYLLEAAERVVQNDGIQFANTRYVDKEGKLAAHIGKKIRIFFDRNDKSTVRVYARTAEKEDYLCTAYPNLGAHRIGEQSKAVRQELGKDIQASRRRLKEPRSGEKPAPSSTSRPPVQKPPLELTPSTHRIIRYRFEIEEKDDADPDD